MNNECPDTNLMMSKRKSMTGVDPLSPPLHRKDPLYHGLPSTLNRSFLVRSVFLDELVPTTPFVSIELKHVTIYDKKVGVQVSSTSQ